MYSRESEESGESEESERFVSPNYTGSFVHYNNLEVWEEPLYAERYPIPINAEVEIINRIYVQRDPAFPMNFNLKIPKILQNKIIKGYYNGKNNDTYQVTTTDRIISFNEGDYFFVIKQKPISGGKSRRNKKIKTKTKTKTKTKKNRRRHRSYRIKYRRNRR